MKHAKEIDDMRSPATVRCGAEGTEERVLALHCTPMCARRVKSLPWRTDMTSNASLRHAGGV